MDRVITLKKNFLAGEPSVPVSGSGTEDYPFCSNDSLNIQVVNMSLGGLTLAAGRDFILVDDGRNAEGRHHAGGQRGQCRPDSNDHR